MESSHDLTEGVSEQVVCSHASGSPSGVLLAAALAGLLGGGCEGAPGTEPGPGTRDTTTVSPGGGGAGAEGGGGSGGSPKILEKITGDRTFADVRDECDQRGGYTQIHAACAGVNSCAGISYADLNPGITLVHTCAGLNACNGISCVVLPEDAGRTGQEVYEGAGAKGVHACTGCHAVEDAGGGLDATKFKLYLPPGSQRSAASWLELPAKAQERIVAFGKQGLLDDGTAYANMAPYHKEYSRAEIERVVEYIRTDLEVVPATYAVSD